MAVKHSMKVYSLVIILLKAFNGRLFITPVLVKYGGNCVFYYIHGPKVDLLGALKFLYLQVLWHWDILIILSIPLLSS